MALAAIIFGAHLFVRELTAVSVAAGVPTLVISLLITPVATELPEKFNSVMWMRQRKDTLALGNITGAMVFQSTFPVAIGLAFTDWRLYGAEQWYAMLAVGPRLAVGSHTLRTAALHQERVRGGVASLWGRALRRLPGRDALGDPVAPVSAGARERPVSLLRAPGWGRSPGRRDAQGPTAPAPRPRRREDWTT